MFNCRLTVWTIGLPLDHRAPLENQWYNY